MCYLTDHHLTTRCIRYFLTLHSQHVLLDRSTFNNLLVPLFFFRSNMCYLADPHLTSAPFFFSSFLHQNIFLSTNLKKSKKKKVTKKQATKKKSIYRYITTFVIFYYFI